MSTYKVLVVDDSPFMRKVFSDFIAADPAFEVAGTASDGAEALERTLAIEPDVITMDLEMPVMNGLEALRRVMAMRPTPVIMLSAVTDNGTRDTIRALQLGAIDFIRKPDGAVKQDIRQVGEQLREKLHMAVEMAGSGNYRNLPAVEEAADEAPAASSAPAPAAAPPAANKPAAPPASATAETGRAERRQAAPPPAARPRTRAADAAARPKTVGPAPPDRAPPAAAAPGARDKAPQAAPPPRRPAGGPSPQIAGPPAGKRPKPAGSAAFAHLVAIGTSTGGPRALHEVLTNIPAGFPAPILVVQHMPPKFTLSLAQRLDTFSHIRVREARDGEVVETGTAYIAPGGKHMTLAGGPSAYRIVLTDEQPRSGHKPSVDRLFESLIGLRQLRRHIVLMTGMGSDGARGMLELKNDGAETLIAEAEQTCIVYGMPRSAVENGAASQVLRLQQIAPALVRKLG